MQIKIWSHFEGHTWEGDIPDGTSLEGIFRMFNRVDETDTMPDTYRLPSLSVGDMVDVNNQRWIVAPLGFSLVDVDTPLDDLGPSSGGDERNYAAVTEHRGVSTLIGWLDASPRPASFRQ